MKLKPSFAMVLLLLSLTAVVSLLLAEERVIAQGYDADEYCASCQKAYDDIMEQCPYKETDPDDPQCVAAATDAKLSCQLQRCIYITKTVTTKKNNTEEILRFLKVVPPSFQQELGTFAKPCALKSANVSNASSFECAPCCQEAQAIYNTCMRMKSVGDKCTCISYAYYGCLQEHGGCGPCQCCADWIRVGQDNDCWESEEEAKRAVEKLKQKQ